MGSGREAHFHGTCERGKTLLGQKGVVRVCSGTLLKRPWINQSVMHAGALLRRHIFVSSSTHKLLSTFKSSCSSNVIRRQTLTLNDFWHHRFPPTPLPVGFSSICDRQFDQWNIWILAMGVSNSLEQLKKGLVQKPKTSQHSMQWELLSHLHRYKISPCHMRKTTLRNENYYNLNTATLPTNIL